MTIQEFKAKLSETPKSIKFTDTMAVIDENYDFTPTAFTNGDLENKAGENSGSCKLFSFAKEQEFTQEETLTCFGSIYFEEVLGEPDGNGHQNIRNFMKTGFEGLSFSGQALSLKD